MPSSPRPGIDDSNTLHSEGPIHSIRLVESHWSILQCLVVFTLLSAGPNHCPWFNSLSRRAINKVSHSHSLTHALGSLKSIRQRFSCLEWPQAFESPQVIEILPVFWLLFLYSWSPFVVCFEFQKRCKRKPDHFLIPLYVDLIFKLDPLY